MSLVFPTYETDIIIIIIIGKQEHIAFISNEESNRTQKLMWRH